MNSQYLRDGLIIVAGLFFCQVAIAESYGSACNISVTNNYDSSNKRYVYIYIGSDDALIGSYQEDSVAYNTTQDFNCGLEQEKCKIRWETSGLTHAGSDWQLGHHSVECDGNYLITTENS